VIVGAPESASTVKAVLVETEPPGAVTVMAPVVAVAGTVVTICVVVAETIVAEIPLKLTLFWPAVAPNPVSLIVTVVPTTPFCGVNEMMESWLKFAREIERIFPIASYL
jgi:hypothetical protein